MGAAMALSVSRIRGLFTYDPDTGKLYRIKFRGAYLGTALAVDEPEIIIDGRRYRTNRVIWCYVNGRWPVGQVLPVNGDIRDTRIDNLKETGTANMRASGKLLGAHLNRRTGKWYAMISRNGKNKSLGTFMTPEEAHRVYLQARDGAVAA
jgi:hypothetical protein